MLSFTVATFHFEVFFTKNTTTHVSVVRLIGSLVTVRVTAEYPATSSPLLKRGGYAVRGTQ